MPKTKSLNFEQSLTELEKLVEQLEKGDLPLDDALKKYEAGIKLSRECQSTLKEAQMKVTTLMEEHPDQDGDVDA